MARQRQQGLPGSVLVGWPKTRLGNNATEKIVEEPEMDTKRLESITVEDLTRVLASAYSRITEGKGIKKHGSKDKPLGEQPWVKIITLLREEGLGFLRGQIIKKTSESTRLSKEGAIFELLDVIAYAAFTILALEKTDDALPLDRMQRTGSRDSDVLPCALEPNTNVIAMGLKERVALGNRAMVSVDKSGDFGNFPTSRTRHQEQA